MPLIIHTGTAAWEKDLLMDDLSRSQALEILGMWRCRYCRHYNEPNCTCCSTCGGPR
jgi:hypothetical protein